MPKHRRKQKFFPEVKSINKESMLPFRFYTFNLGWNQQLELLKCFSKLEQVLPKLQVNRIKLPLVRYSHLGYNLDFLNLRISQYLTRRFRCLATQNIQNIQSNIYFVRVLLEELCSLPSCLKWLLHTPILPSRKF